MVKCFVICLLIALASSQEEENTAGETTCKDLVVTRGDVGYVTCQFPDDVSNVRPVAFSVELYPPDKIDATTVLDCSWVSQDPVQCTVEKGYEFDGSLTSSLSLKITKASEDNVGRYACKIMASSLRPSPRTCSLELRERDTTAATLSPPQARTESVSTTTKATNISKSAQAGGSIVIVAVVVPVAIVIVLAVVAVVVVWRKRLLCFKKERGDAESGAKNEEEEVPLNAPPVDGAGKNDAVITDTKEKDSDQNTPEKKDGNNGDDDDKDDDSGGDDDKDDDSGGDDDKDDDKDDHDDKKE